MKQRKLSGYDTSIGLTHPNNVHCKVVARDVQKAPCAHVFVYRVLHESPQCYQESQLIYRKQYHHNHKPTQFVFKTHTSIRNCGKHARVLHKNKMHDVQTFAYIMPFNVATDRMTENTNEANTIQCGGATTFTFGLGRTNHNERTKRNE